jgi:hypothetical protein
MNVRVAELYKATIWKDTPFSSDVIGIFAQYESSLCEE